MFKNIKLSKITISMLFLVSCAMLSACGTSGNDVSVTPSPAPVITEAPAATDTPTPSPTDAPVYIDYAATLTLDMTSETAKVNATVRNFVDGDTVHFNVPADVIPEGLLKARFLAINTPESTGKIEEWGKAASAFTKEKLQNAASIILESDNSSWNLDSTGGRYLVWVWYKTDDASEYRNLNLEILQNGLAIASSTANNRYGTIAMAALSNAKACKLKIYSGEQDPDFYYGDAYELTLSELRQNIADYNGKKVAFEGVVTMNSENTVYVEEYDPENDLYNGIAVYYGYNLSGGGLEILHVGNRVRIVGSCQYYEAGGTYQIADVQYKVMKPNDPSNLQLISTGHSAAFALVSADQFVNGRVTTEDENGNTKEFSYAELIVGSTISMDNLEVYKTSTTTNESSSSYGAMTLYCKSEDGLYITVRTAVLYDENRNLITADRYEGENISVKGIVEYYNGNYQIKVLSKEYITINH